MTDLETLKAMFDRAKVPYTETAAGHWSTELQEPFRTPHDLRCIEVNVNVEEGSTTVIGYNDFTSSFYFNEDGSLAAVGAWE
jgi:hypothetical protein